MIEDIKVYGLSGFALTHSYIIDLQPVLNLAIALLTIVYLIYKIRNTKDENQSNIKKGRK